MTPCEKLGYKVGDRFVVKGSPYFQDHSIVELFFDDGTESPKWKLIEGHCKCRNAAGDPVAYEIISYMTPCSAKQKITLQPGDYVLTEGMDEATYHKVAQKFLEAGAGKGEYPDMEWLQEFDYFGWALAGGLHHTSCLLNECGEKEVPVDQVLGEDVADTLPEVGSRWIDPAGDEVEVAAHHHGHLIIVGAYDDGELYTEFCEPDELKPLKTEREKAVEDIFDDIKSAPQTYPGIEAPFCVAEHLYELGYRKTGERHGTRTR